MSYYAADSRGYLRDVASVHGWHQFVEWAETVGGAVDAFVDTGQTEDIETLAKSLANLTAPTPSVESTRRELLEAARAADEILILSDGTSDDLEPLRTAGGEGSGNFGHAGRPGEVGGSAPGPGGAKVPTLTSTPMSAFVSPPADYVSPYPDWMMVGLKPMMDPADKSIWWVPEGSKVDYHSNPTPETFIEARNKTTRPGYLSPLTPDELKGQKLYLSKDGSVGGAVTKEGDMGNLFNNGGPKGAAQEVLIDMIKDGGKTADAFDGYLPRLYANFGLQETGRMKFNPDYAPEGWNYERDDNPDVVFLARTEDAANAAGGADDIRGRLKDKGQWIAPKRTTIYHDDYDRAKRDAVTRAESGRARSLNAVPEGSGRGVGDEARGVRAGGGPSVERGLGGEGSGHFDHAGRPGEVGGSAPSGADDLMKHLGYEPGSLTRPMAMLGDLPVPQKAYSAYLEKNGKEWKAAPLPKDVKRGKPGNCYANATRLMMDNPEYRYVEGLAYSENFPDSIGVCHAWVVDNDDNVIDNTWKNPEKARYFGVEYDRTQYTVHLLRTKMFGVFGGKPTAAQDVLEKGGL